MSRVLRTIVFIGSARDSSPPWGGDKRLGDRIVNHVLAALRNRNQVFRRAHCPASAQIERERCSQLLGGEVITHDVTVLDPVKIFGDGGELSGDGEMRLPHFFAKQGSLPGADKLAQTIKAADAIIVISPEYNHSVPPALSSLLGTQTSGQGAGAPAFTPCSVAGHFGGSNYAGKPSAIITYSPGPWGGALVLCVLLLFLLKRPSSVAIERLWPVILSMGMGAFPHWHTLVFALLLGRFSGSASFVNFVHRLLSAGMRAAMALRPLLSELGCLSISKLTGYPSVSCQPTFCWVVLSR
jgi:NAD(P)H-dependent FMN reductase